MHPARISLLSAAPAILCASPSRCSPPVWPPLLCLYCVQPILPVLSNEFGVSPASSSISLSISTAMLAVGLLFTGPLSDAIGRKPVMVTALLLAACCSLLSTMMTSWHGILIMRALIGLSLSGVAAVGMTYLE